jgi:pimeloyl-ACP methyl ester carboxylesterase
MSRAVFASLSLMLASVVACGGGPTAPSTPPSPSVPPSGSPAPASSPPAAPSLAADPVQLTTDIDVGGRTLHLFCVGTAAAGQPTVLGESGLMGDSRTWNHIFYAVAERTRVCAYDRAGLNQSQPAPEPSRTLQDQVDDLRALLTAPELAGPIVFAAHSSGAWIVSLYASQHPEDILGVVLVDPRGSHVSAEWLAALPPKAEGEAVAVSANRDELTTFDSDPSLNDEHLDLTKAMKQVNEVLDPKTPLFGDRPLIVLQAGLTPGSWSDLPDEIRVVFDRAWHDGQSSFLAESTKSSAVVVEDSDHELPEMRPDAIVEALFEVLDQVGS